MSEETTSVKQPSEKALAKRITVSEAAKEIDKIAEGAMSLFSDNSGGFEQELAVARAIIDMRALLTPEVMAPVMALMNTELGFLTDRDPKRAKRGETIEPYGVDVVRDVFIESRIRGFRMVGNEINIIANKLYGAQNGFRRKVLEFDGLTDFQTQKAMPKTIDGKTAEVDCRATWKIKEKPQELSATFPVKIDGYSSFDQIHGKADKKLYKAVWQRLTGQNIPEGDLDDPANMKQANATHTNAPTFTKPEPGPTSGTQPQNGGDKPKPAEPGPVGILARIYTLVEALPPGVTEDHVVDVLKRQKRIAPEIEELAQCQDNTLAWLEENWEMVGTQAGMDAKGAKREPVAAEGGLL